MAYISVTYSFSNGAGNTIDATKENQNFTDIVNGLSDGTKSVSVDDVSAGGDLAVTGKCKLGGAEALRIWTYTDTVSAAEETAGEIDITVSAVTKTNVRSMTSVVYATPGSVEATTDIAYAFYSRPELTTTTNVNVSFGASVAEDDVISITIIEAI